MAVRFHPHALERMKERGASKEEVKTTINHGEQFPAKHGQLGFRRNFSVDLARRGTGYRSKQVGAYAVKEGKDWIVITIITRYF